MVDICHGFNGQICFEPAVWLVEHPMLKKPLHLCKGHTDEVNHYLRKNVPAPTLTRINQEETNGGE